MAERTDPYLPADTLPGNEIADPIQVAQVPAPALPAAPSPAPRTQVLDQFTPPENFRTPEPVPFRVPQAPSRQRTPEPAQAPLIPPDQFAKNLEEFNKAIGYSPDPGVGAGRGQTAFNAFGQGVAQGAGADVPKAIGIVQGHIGGTDPRDTRAFQMGEQIDKFLESTLPTNPQYRSDLFTYIIPNAIGQGAGTIASFLTGAGFAKLGFSAGARALGSSATLGSTGLKVAGAAATVPANFSSMAVEGFEDAIKHGAKLEDAFSSFYANGALGATEFLPIVRALGRADDASGGTVSRTLSRFIKNGKLRQAGEAGIDELIQETIQTIGSNLIASDFVAYDPKRQVFEGVAEAGTTGFTVGALYGLLFAMLPGRQRGTPQATPENNGPGTPPGAPPGSPQLPPPGSPSGPAPTDPTAPPGVSGPNYFNLPPPPSNADFLGGQIERLTKIDSELKANDPTYLTDPNIGETIQFFRYLEQSERDFDRLRAMDPVGAKSAANQLLAQEVQQNRELIELLKDPVRMVTRPTYVLQQAGNGRKPGKVIPIQTDENGDPILKRNGQWVVTAQGDKAIGAGRVMRIDDTRPENLALSPVGQRMVREARERMMAERGRMQAAMDAASAETRSDPRKPRAGGPSGQPRLEPPVQMRPDSAPGPMQSVEDAALANASENQQRQRQRAQSETEATLRAASASQRPDPSRFIEVDSLPDDLVVRMRARALQLGQELPPVIAKQDLLDAGVDPGRVQTLFARRAAEARIADSATGEKIASERALERAGVPLAGKGPAAILSLMPKGDPRTYRVLKNILTTWRKTLGKDLDALAIVDLTAWIKRDPKALKRIGGNGTETAAFLHSFLKRTTSRVENTALAFSQGKPAVYLRDVSHELTHLMLYVRNVSPEAMSDLWSKVSKDAADGKLDAKTKAIFDRIVRDYDGSPDAVLGEEFLAYATEGFMADRYSTRADLRAVNGETYSWADQLHDLIKTFYRFVRDLFNGVLNRDVVSDFLKGLETTHGVEFLNPAPQPRADTKPTPEQYDARFARRIEGTHSPFFSPLVRQMEAAIEQKSLPMAGMGSDYAGLLNNWAASGLVTREELAWTRVDDQQGLLDYLRANADQRFSALSLLDMIRKNAVSVRASEPFLRNSDGGDARDGLDFHFSERRAPDSSYVRETADEYWLDEEIDEQFGRNTDEYDDGVNALMALAEIIPAEEIAAAGMIPEGNSSFLEYLETLDSEYTKENFETVRDLLAKTGNAFDEFEARLKAKPKDGEPAIAEDLRRRLLAPISDVAKINTHPTSSYRQGLTVSLLDHGGDVAKFEAEIARLEVAHADANPNGISRNVEKPLIEWLLQVLQDTHYELDRQIDSNMEAAKSAAYDRAYESELENTAEIHVDRNLGYEIEGSPEVGDWVVRTPNGDEIGNASTYDRAVTLAQEHAQEAADAPTTTADDGTLRGPKWGDRLPYSLGKNAVRDYRDTLLIYENDQVEYTSPSAHWSDKDTNIVAFLRHAAVTVTVDGKQHDAEAMFEAQSDAAKGNAQSRAAERRLAEIDGVIDALTVETRNRFVSVAQELGIQTDAATRILDAGDVRDRAKRLAVVEEVGSDAVVSRVIATPLEQLTVRDAVSAAQASPLAALSKFGHAGYQQLVALNDFIQAAARELGKLGDERLEVSKFTANHPTSIPAMPYTGNEFEKIAQTWVPLVARYHLWRGVAEGRSSLLMVSGEASAELWGASTYRYLKIEKADTSQVSDAMAPPALLDALNIPVEERIQARNDRAALVREGQMELSRVLDGTMGGVEWSSTPVSLAERRNKFFQSANAPRPQWIVSLWNDDGASPTRRTAASDAELRDLVGSDVYDSVKKKLTAVGPEGLRLEGGVDMPQSYFTSGEAAKKGYRVIYDRMYLDAIRDIFKKMKWGEPNIRRVPMGEDGQFAWFMEIPDNVREFFTTRSEQPVPLFGARFARRASPELQPDTNIQNDPQSDDIAGGPSVRFARRVRDIEFADPSPSAFAEGADPSPSVNAERGKAALAAVRDAQVQPGTLPRVAKAMYRNLIGWIGFVGNDTSKGIAHIDRMPERKDLLARLPDLIANGVVGPYYVTPRLDGRFYSIRRNIVSDGETVVIAATIDGRAEPWVLTARPRTDNTDDAMFNRSAGGVPVTEEQGAELLRLAAAGDREQFNAVVETAIRESSNLELFTNQPVFAAKFARRGTEPAPPTYSALYNAIMASDRETAPAGVWQAWLKEATKRGATEAEIKWSGLREWLADRKGPIQRDDVLEFLRRTEVRFEETTLSGDETRWGMDDYRKEMLEVPGLRFDYTELLVRWSPGYQRGWTVDKAKNGTYSVYGAGIRMSGFPTENAAVSAASTATPVFKTLHWDQIDNPLLHLRFNTRIDADGKKVLFVEEFQSDWHNRGRANGYADRSREELKAATVAAERALNIQYMKIKATAQNAASAHRFTDGQFANMLFDVIEDPRQERRPQVSQTSTSEELAINAVYAATAPLLVEYNRLNTAYIKAYEQEMKAPAQVPRAPLSDGDADMVGYAMKRLVRYAADNGFDRVAWTPGSAQATRYNLDMHVGQVGYALNLDNKTYRVRATDPDQVRINLSRLEQYGIDPNAMTLDQVRDVFGPNIAQKIEKGAGVETDSGRMLSGLDLKVDDKPKRDLYDGVVPNVASKIAKAFGGKLTKSVIETEAAQVGRVTWPGGPLEAKAIDITDDMREAALDLGFARFARRGPTPPPPPPGPGNTGGPNQPSWFQAMTAWIGRHDPIFTQTSQRMRAVGGTRAAYELGNEFRRDIHSRVGPAGQQGLIGEDFHSTIQGALGRFVPRLADMLADMAPSARLVLADVLRGRYLNPATGRVTIPAGSGLTVQQAQAVRQYLNDVLDFTNQHMQGLGQFGPAKGTAYVTQADLIGKIANYFPQQWRIDGTFGDEVPALRGESREAAALEFFKAVGLYSNVGSGQNAAIREMMNNINGLYGFVSYASSSVGPIGRSYQLADSTLKRVLQIDPTQTYTITVGGRQVSVSLSDFLDNEPSHVLLNYTSSMVRHAEWVRRFGPKGEVIDDYMQRIDRQRLAAGQNALTPDEQNIIVKAIQSNVGGLRRPNQTFDTFQQWVQVVGNAIYLSLSTLASLPELIMPAVRTGLTGQLYAYRAGLRSLFTASGVSKDRQFARELGIIHEDAHIALQNSVVDYGDFNIQKWNQRIFSAIGLNLFTRWTQTMATSAGRFALPGWARRAAAGSTKHQRWLQEVGLTAQDLAGYDPENYVPGTRPKIDAALRQIATEIVINPTHAAKAQWMNDPRFRLVAHIKSYMWGFNNTILQRVGRETINGNMMPLIFLIGTMAMSGAIAELREWLIWGEEGNPALKKLRETNDPALLWIYTAAERGGAFGPIGPLVSMMSQTRAGASGTWTGTLVPAIGMGDSALKVARGSFMYAATQDPAELRMAVDGLTRFVPGLVWTGTSLAFDTNRADVVDALAPRASQVPAAAPSSNPRGVSGR